MADLSDVENALVSLISGALFPAGGYVPGAMTASVAIAAPIPTPAVPAPSPAPVSVRLFRGWPQASGLTADLATSCANVTVFSEVGMTRNVSRWMGGAYQVSANAPTITASVAGFTVTLTGTITQGNVVAVRGGRPLTAYAYVVQAGNTLTTVAAALAAKVPGASSAGAVITMPSALSLAAATAVAQQALTVVRQSAQGVRVSIWAPTPLARDAVASVVDNALAGLRNNAGFLTSFFAVGSNERARLVYRSSATNDAPSRDLVWRRDLNFTVEYPTTLLETDPVMLFGGGGVALTGTGTSPQSGFIAPS